MTIALGLVAGALWGWLCARRGWEWRAMLVGALVIGTMVAIARA